MNKSTTSRTANRIRPHRRRAGTLPRGSPRTLLTSSVSPGGISRITSSPVALQRLVWTSTRR
eukprot:7885947-Pyramimonas_sp.AAC.1